MQQSERDLLIEINTRLKVIEKNLDNHLRHHWAVSITALGIALSSVIGLVVSLFIP